jgi:hypothetical protein
MEHLAVESDLQLREVCVRLAMALRTTAFAFDCENETEWGIAKLGELEINVSRPYDVGTLREWDDTVPIGFDLGVTIEVPRDVAVPAPERIAAIAQTIATSLGAVVVHHRTWTGVGQNVERSIRYAPLRK